MVYDDVSCAYSVSEFSHRKHAGNELHLGGDDVSHDKLNFMYDDDGNGHSVSRHSVIFRGLAEFRIGVCMAIKVYEINGVWNTYEYWHDHEGYTTEATVAVSYKTCSVNDWGSAAQDGYWGEGDLYDFLSTKFWAQGVVGWYSPNGIAEIGLCPADATAYIMESNSDTSDAFGVTDLSGTSYYLLRKLLSSGWRTGDEWDADGWTPRPVPVGIPICGVLSSSSDEQMRLSSLPFGTLEKWQPNIEMLFGIYWSWVNAEWLAYPLAQNSPYYSNIISQSDRDKLVAFGLTYSTGGPYISSGWGAVDWSDSFSFEPIGVYADIEGTQLMQDDMSEFYCRNTNNLVTIDKLTIGYGSTVKAWKCRITKL